MPQMPLTRPTLMIRLRDPSDGDAWQQFLELYGPAVYRLFRGRGLQDADAADLTQDVLGVVATGSSMRGFDPERGSFRAWLYGVTRNKLNDFFARESKTTAGSGDTSTLDIIHGVPGEDEEFDRWEREYQRQLFSLAADKTQAVVDETTWQAFWQTAVDGRPGREVAENLNMTIGAVYVAKSRVMTRIRQHISQLEED